MNYENWIRHFDRNRHDRLEPDWAAACTLSEDQRRALAWSLAEYQLGDGGGPCRLIARDAETFRGAAAGAARVVDLWFAEEREHSRLLLGAVRRLRGTIVQETLAFRLFCAVRRSLGVQFEMLVLLIVEIVSTGYYRVIRRHAGDAPIAAMCRLIMRDEAGHIAFHRDRLAARHPQGIGKLWALWFQALGFACAGFLWWSHGQSFRALGVARGELFGHVRSGLRLFLRRLNTKTPAGSRDAGVERSRMEILVSHE